MARALLGKYQLLAELGRGGMADVFLAISGGAAGSSFGFNKLTVVKRLRSGLAEEADVVAMFVDEARIAARLNHPNVVQTFEVGRAEGEYFLSMEYLEGQSLHRVQIRAASLRNAGAPSPLSKGLQYVALLDTLSGLHHAHELCDFDGTSLDVVHRDVTPQNVFVTYDGQVKVLDFGIAKSVGRVAETKQGAVKGKVRYMAPEQALGQAVDRRADIFSVGVMLWEVATGQYLWKGVPEMAILRSLLAGEIASSPRAIDPSVPEAIDAMCRKALSVRPEDRYQTADEFRVELDRFLAESGQLVDGRRRLGLAVAELFKDKRDEIRLAVEQQLSALKSVPYGDLVPVMLALSEPSTGGSDAAYVKASYNSRAGGRRSWVRVVLASGVGVCALGALLVGLRVGSGRNPLAASTAKIEAAADEGARATPAADQVQVKVTATPASAVLTIDGERVPLPYEVAVPRAAQRHVVRVEAPGFEPQSHDVRYEANVALAVTLAKSAAPAAPAAPGRPASHRWQPPARSAPAPAPPPAAETAAPATPSPTAGAATAPKVKPDLDNVDPWGSGSKPRAAKPDLDQVDPWRH